MRRLSLPGYPFAEERYWVTDLATGLVANPVQTGAWLHPMLERNTSDFYQQRFSSRWQGDESWFVDHQVDSRKTLPGVGYLEMARAAIARSLEAQALQAGTLQFKNIVWLTPYSPTPQHNELHIELTLEQQKVDFRIYSQTDGVALEHCKGSAQVIPTANVQPLDLDSLCAAPWRTLDIARRAAITTFSKSAAASKDWDWTASPSPAARGCRAKSPSAAPRTRPSS